MNAHGVIPQSLPLDRLCRDKKQRKQKRVESKSKQASEYILEYIYIYIYGGYTTLFVAFISILV